MGRNNKRKSNPPQKTVETEKNEETGEEICTTTTINELGEGKEVVKEITTTSEAPDGRQITTTRVERTFQTTDPNGPTPDWATGKPDEEKNMPDSKHGSKADLNESNMPLLDDAEKPGEKIELKEKDDSTEKEKKKDKKGKKNKGPNCFQKKTADLDLVHRDHHDINTEIDLDFSDVLAEPDSAQGFDCVWKSAYFFFEQTRIWLYRLLAAIVAIPASIIWGIIFAILTVLYVWIGQPVLRIFEFFVYIVRRVWNGIMRCTLEPVCAAAGSFFGRMRVDHRRNVLVETA